MSQAIVTKYLGATDTKCARIQVKSWLGTKYYSYDYSAEKPHTEAFNQWLKETNAKFVEKYGDGMAYKLLAGAAPMPDDGVYCFIIK